MGLEELTHYFAEQYRNDLIEEGEARGRARGRAERRAEGKAEGMNMLKHSIKTFSTANPNYSVQDIATLFNVDEELVRSLVPGRS